MPKRWIDENGVSHYASDGSISKFERIPKENGRVFGGRVAVDVERIPTKLQRRRLLKIHGEQLSTPEHEDLIRVDVGSPPKIITPEAQVFESPEHADLIRVD